MRYSARIHATDLLDQVIVVAVVCEWDDDGKRTERDAVFSTQLSGVGETEARRWLCDALIGLAETL